jgi:hypothetical protein
LAVRLLFWRSLMPLAFFLRRDIDVHPPTILVLEYTALSPRLDRLRE